MISDTGRDCSNVRASPKIALQDIDSGQSPNVDVAAADAFEKRRARGLASSPAPGPLVALLAELLALSVSHAEGEKPC
ncbi:MAG: hypothetical protein ABSC36_02250 [Gaiellaceae bacterium]|jgi:hypothetical protein